MQKLLIALLVVFGSLWVSADDYTFETNENIYVVGDVHGAFDNLFTTLVNFQLIDQAGNWTGGKAHLVSLGDLIDRGKDSRKVLDLFIRIQEQADEAGGKVHVVLGNHEVMNLKSDLRYVSKPEFLAFKNEVTASIRKKKYKEFLKAYRLNKSEKNLALFERYYPPGYFSYVEQFNSKGKYGKWLLSQPFLIKINDELFAHGGLSDRLEEFDLESINSELRGTIERYLRSWGNISKSYPGLFYPSFKDRYRALSKARSSNTLKQFLRTENSLLFSMQSPTWYRGNSICHQYYEDDKLTATLKHFSATRVWVGHTPTLNSKPNRRLSGKVVIMDTGMLTAHYGGKPHIAVLTSDAAYQAYNGLTKEPVKVKQPQPAQGVNPFNLTDKQSEIILKKATVVERKTIDSTTQQLLLDYDGNSLDALFFSANDQSQGDSNSTVNHFHHELAAYKLDRLLNIGLVPTTVMREIDGVSGALQFLHPDTISESELISERDGKIDFCPKSDQDNLRDVFGYLTQNPIGILGDTYYTKDNGFILLTNNLGSFSTSTRFTSKARPEEVFVSAAFKKALIDLGQDDLVELEPFLTSEQLSALIKRRDRLVTQ